jgi:hypothetical protein
LLNTPCPDRNKIRNPETGYCVSREGRIGKKVLEEQRRRALNTGRRSSEHKSPERKVPESERRSSERKSPENIFPCENKYVS